MRVLVIEDDAALNGILAKRLAEEGHSVDCCFDGRDGLDYAEAADYDCIVLDWMLPKMDGLTLLRRLRGGETTQTSCCSRPRIPSRTGWPGWTPGRTTIW